jgi:hypothetical protein
VDVVLSRLPGGDLFLAANGQLSQGTGGDLHLCLAFLAERLAFYSRSCSEAGDVPSRHRTVSDLMRLLEVVLATLGRSG